MDNSASLFDQIDSDRFTEPGESAPRFERVNRSNKPSMHRVRSLWEDWNARFPDRSGGLRSRFRGDDHNHDGAVFELFLHELLTRLGLSVDVEPQLEDGGIPDFLVSGADGAAYVEATYLKQSFTTPALEGPVLDAINELEEDVSPVIGLAVEVKGTLKRAPSLAPIRRHAADWLNRLNPQTVNWQRKFQTTFAVDPEYGDWRLTLTAIPRGLGGGLIVIGPRRSGPFNDHAELGKAVERKASRYRDLMHPLVVAANIPSFDAERIEESTLFGPPAVRFQTNSADETWRFAGLARSGQALWVDNEHGRTRNNGLTALMMVHDLAPHTIPNVSVCLYLNPLVGRQVPDALRSFGYAAVAGGELQRHEGSRTVHEVLGLSAGWLGIFDASYQE